MTFHHEFFFLLFPRKELTSFERSYTSPFAKIKMDKERFKLRRKYVLNSLNEPQHLAKIKTLNLPKIQNKELEKLRERKLQNNELNSVRTNNKSKRETSTLVFQFFDVIC